MSAPGTLHLERMTWPAVRDALAAGYTTAVVACGAVEQHGPHLPLFMDAEHGAALAEGLARRLGRALVAPPVRLGCSEHHMAFPGTISLSEATFRGVCRDYCASLGRHGFRRILFVPSHGGNFAPLERALDELREAAGGAEVEAFTELTALIELWRAVVEAEDPALTSRVGGHADLAESSIMLALHPALVREEAAEAGFAGALTPEVLERLFRDGIAAISPNGILGDARGMSAALGTRLIDAAVEMLAERFGAAV